MPQPNENPGQTDTRQRGSTSQPGRDQDSGRTDQRNMHDQDLDKKLGEDTEQEGADQNPNATGSQKGRGSQGGAQGQQQPNRQGSENEDEGD